MKNILISSLLGLSILIASCSKTSNITGYDNTVLTEHASDTFPDVYSDRELFSRAISESADTAMAIVLKSLDGGKYVSDKHNSQAILKDLKKFYMENDNELVWYNEIRPKDETYRMLDQLMKAGNHGLDPKAYDLYRILNLQREIYENDKEKEPKPEALAELDLRTTVAYLTYARHLKFGKTPPYLEEKKLIDTGRKEELGSFLATHSVSEAVADLTPDNIIYKNTEEALRTYRSFEGQRWETFPNDLVLKEGDSSGYIKDIADRLKLEGYLDRKYDISGVYDGKLVEAISRYQVQHGIEADSIFGPATAAALNMSLEEKIALLEGNLERMKWMPEDLGEHYILINIPAYKMQIFEEDEVAIEMNVIVGKDANRTPVFFDEMEYIVFSPTWTVPKSIIEQEMVAKIREDDKYLERNNYTVYASWDEDAPEVDPRKMNWKKFDPEKEEIRIVQGPGKNNALGNVKFIFPNSSSIYLHDTPQDHLFSRRERAFSHGCIRVEDPVKLAEYLLDDRRKWDEEKIQEAMEQEEPVQVNLPSKIPVYLVYRSAWADEEGKVHFIPDIYSYDEEITRQ